MKEGDVPYNAIMPEIENNKTLIGLLYQIIPIEKLKKREMHTIDTISYIDSYLNELLIHIHRVGRSDYESYAKDIDEEEKAKLSDFYINNKDHLEKSIETLKRLQYQIYNTI